MVVLCYGGLSRMIVVGRRGACVQRAGIGCRVWNEIPILLVSRPGHVQCKASGLGTLVLMQ